MISIFIRVGIGFLLLNSHVYACQKEYLVVGLHGIDGQGDDIQALLPQFIEVYAKNNPPIDINKFEIWCPTAPTANKWFELPALNMIGIVPLVYSYATNTSMNDYLINFQSNLDTLKRGIAERLEILKLDYNDVILFGLSQGGITALSLAVQMPKPIKAVISLTGMWIPTTALSAPQNILLISGNDDVVIPKYLSWLAEFDLTWKLSSNSFIQINRFPKTGHEVTPRQMITISDFLNSYIVNKS